MISIRSLNEICFPFVNDFLKEEFSEFRKSKIKIMNDKVKQMKIAEMKKRGCICESCGKHFLHSLEFHHIQMCFEGKGRGRNYRIRQIVKYPSRYALMCKICHRKYSDLQMVLFYKYATFKKNLNHPMVLESILKTLVKLNQVYESIYHSLEIVEITQKLEALKK